jgi:peptidoglycan/xylan/chitin deacetylase (PgdA/CDA1 family)
VDSSSSGKIKQTPKNGAIMKIMSIVFLFINLVLSCQAPKVRLISSESAQSENTETNLSQKKFDIIMNQDLSGQKRESFINFITRQRDFYYIAQDLLNQFDKQLNQLHKQKKSGQNLLQSDLENFEKIKFQLRIAWEFSERNLHELTDLYELVLTHANDKESKHHTASRLIINQWPSWMEAGWKTGDQLAIISIGQYLNDVNSEFKFKMPAALIVNFDRYAKATNATRQKAHQQSLKFSNQRAHSLIDSFIAKEWNDYKVERLNAENADQEIRIPQALDILEPAADGKGHVTGNRFPAGVWALTFDDGPNPVHTRGMFNVLKSNDVNGTFFWLTKNILLYKDLVSEAKQLGFFRASHSYTHAQLSKLDANGLNKEITQAITDFATVVGERPTLFRCPYGDCAGNGSAVRQLIAKNNMLHVAWNVDTLDWQDKNPQSVFERTKKQVDVLGRGIVLFHDIHPQSVDAMKLLVPYMKNVKKFKIMPLPEIISMVREKKYVSP